MPTPHTAELFLMCEILGILRYRLMRLRAPIASTPADHAAADHILFAIRILRDEPDLLPDDPLSHPTDGDSPSIGSPDARRGHERVDPPSPPPPSHPTEPPPAPPMPTPPQAIRRLAFGHAAEHRLPRPPSPP